MPFPLLIPFFFFASWVLMMFWGMVSPDVGVATIGYPKAMLVTIGLWLVVFPLARSDKGKKGGRLSFKGGIGREIKEEFAKEATKSRASTGSQTIEDDEINISSSFTGISRRITSQKFRGGSVNTNFGGQERGNY